MEKQPPAAQMSLFPIANQGLFSNNYLEKHLPTSPAWSQHDAKLATIFAGVKDAYRAAAEVSGSRSLHYTTHETLAPFKCRLDHNRDSYLAGGINDPQLRRAFGRHLFGRPSHRGIRRLWTDDRAADTC
jgi:hypothetical protein